MSRLPSPNSRIVILFILSLPFLPGSLCAGVEDLVHVLGNHVSLSELIPPLLCSCPLCMIVSSDPYHSMAIY